MFQQKEINIAPNTKVGDEPKKEINAMHGYIYQLKLLMLFLWRGISKQYSFRLGTEIKEANKFDDLVFEYDEDGNKVYLLLQAKHKLDESTQITQSDLLTDSKGDFNLIKYFLSYQNCKKQTLFMQRKIKNIIICTNIGFDSDNLKNAQIDLVKIDENDILHISCDGKQPERYRFNKNVAISLKRQLQAYNAVQLPKKKITYSDDEIENFLDHLVFAINQPNQAQLDTIIQKDMGEEFNNITTENAYNKLFHYMSNWMIDKNSERFLSHVKGKDLFDKIKIGFPISFNMTNPINSFTGRIQEQDQLHELLKASPLVCITGIGGVGKTELIRKYIIEHAADYDNKLIWINAESYQHLATSFCTLSCDILGISINNVDNEKKKMSSIVGEVYKFISHGKSLFVFDNAEKYKSQNDFDCGIDKFLPCVSPTYNRPHVLITSRNQKWPEDIKVLKLDVFSNEEAMEFLKTSLELKSDVQEEDIKELAGQLHLLPLALQQAVAYIKANNETLSHVGSKFDIRNYLRTYNEMAKDVLDFKFPEDSKNNYTETVFKTWNITLDMIKRKEGGNDALEILYIISYLAPEDISTDMFSNLMGNEKKLGSAIKLLAQYSMVNSKHAMLNVHRVVQQVIRIHLQDREREILKKALKLFNSDNITSRNINHALSVWNYSKKYAKLEEEFWDLTDCIRCALQKSLRFKDVCEFEKNILCNVLQDSSTALNNLAWALMKQGKYDIALKKLNNALLIQNKFEPNNDKLLVIKCHISYVLVAQSKYDEALKNYEDVLVARKNKLGIGHDDTLYVQHEIAKIRSYKGEHEKALQILENILDILKLRCGANDSKIYATKGVMAEVYCKQGKYDESLEIFENIYNECTVEKNHEAFLHKLKNIAKIYLLQSKYNDALTTYQEVLEAEIDIFGEDHPDVLNTRRHITEAQQGLET